MIKNDLLNIIIKASSVFLLAFSFTSFAFSQEISSLKILNSPYDEQHPVISPTGEVFFSVGFNPENLGGAIDLGDIWMAKKSYLEEWEQPIHVKSLSTTGNDVLVGFPDALTAYVYHSGTFNGIKQGIHQYSRFGSEWNYVRPLEMGNFKNQGSHFSGRLSADHALIIMSMTSFGSFGNEDIYVSEQIREGVWTSPQNLGSDINSASQEQTPSISADLTTLYYSSNSNKPGSGRDIFMAKRIGQSWDSWSKPTPLEQVNTEGAELSYVVFDKEKNLAFYTSTQNSNGFGDLMMITHQIDVQESVEEVLVSQSQTEAIQKNEKIEITEIDSVKKETTVATIADASVLIFEKDIDSISTAKVQELAEENNFIISVVDANTKNAIPFEITYANKQGLRKIAADPKELQIAFENNKLERFMIASNGYIPRDFLASEWIESSRETIELQPIKTGASIVLKNIQFNRGTSDFADANSIQLLDDLVDFMKFNPSVRIRLEGHTDNAGDPQLNKELSMNRASKIRAYMTVKGVDFERIRIAGWGGSRPIAENDTEEGKRLNRRVEMIIERIQ
ncbi:outer membrane protein/peptidoglycan-associated (lipo)protein [Belliella baltica DSM 15883]|uniref:Outer membrane protein/peptidoglycan-associated (Lipo)protein n=1 Tax=Belliella baltica (strain DSM 15883 / CIP 108006 / LMG 21964 / BA134) TaxID=866536 RepID=I3Z8K5_BELBD|nr:OmpA family protein [Belliella baltica]AFL85573.1 outer membrane protein/peptidoglycan-associated (lipo)protein [Belliella baltica DSM 15883]